MMNGASLPFTPDCPHEQVSCLNRYELIRKYRCDLCGGVMMCACDETFGRRFLAHQLAMGREEETQTDIPVDLEFVSDACPECRGLKPVPAPLAESFGRTSKIKRNYWRELYFLETLREAEWSGANKDASPEERKAAFAAIECEALEEIKSAHSESPKYAFSEPSQAEILRQYDVDVQAIGAVYCEQPVKGAVIHDGDEILSPETYVSRLYRQLGWSVMPMESAPMHALFGVMMWKLIQDRRDPHVHMVSFGNRSIYEATREKVPIWTPLPDDFGARGYAKRRNQQIADHFDIFSDVRQNMLRLFDCWRPMSSELRQYLWAHRDTDVGRARRLIEILAPSTITSILRYLVADYWGRYLGWPDLLLKKGDEILLIEVKSSNDRLSGDQKRWIADNHEHLGLPFRLVKLHRKAAK
jgi:IS1 family transposase